MSIAAHTVRFVWTASIFIGIFSVIFCEKSQSVNSQQLSPIAFWLAQGSQSVDPQPRPTGSTADPSSRGDCPALLSNAINLTALTPLDKDGVTRTLSQNPTFRFYSPYIEGKYRFRLLKSQKSRNALYTQNITGYDKAGIFAVSLPILPVIKPEEYYFWELEYLCSDKPNTTNPIVFGRLYRDRLTADQQLEFNQIANSDDRIAFYQKYGIWSELVDEIAKLLPVSQVLWQQTLDAEGLQSISKESVLFVQPSPNPIKP